MVTVYTAYAMRRCLALAGALMSKKQSGRDLFEGVAMGSLVPYLREMGSSKA